MKPAIPPVKGTLRKAFSEGCSMWAPVVLPIGKSSQAAHRPILQQNDEQTVCSPESAGGDAGKVK